MGRNEWLACGIILAAFLAGVGLASSASSTPIPWYVSRASGIGAFLALTASMVLGLLVSTKAAEPSVPRIFSFELHGFVSVLALTLVAVHGGALLFDATFHYTVLQLAVPFTTEYAPFATGLGVIATWAMAVVTASFWAKKKIGHQTWRRLHYASFGAYVLSFAHGMAAGSDTTNPFVYWMYAISAMAVAGLLALRIAGQQKAPRPAGAPVRGSR